MNEKSRFGKKLLSIALTAAMASTITAVSATTNVSAVTNNKVESAATKTAVKNSAGAPTFSWDNATVYFLLTDRFYNGNTSNDNSYGRGLSKSGTKVNYDNYAAFQGGDFAGITKKIKEGYFTDLGVNAIWLSAPYEQIHGYCVGCDGNSFAHYSYHGYYVLDYTETDKNFGTKEEFKEMVDTAHEHGIRIVLDIVMNHSGYNTLKDMAEYNFGEIKSGWEDYYYAHSNINNSSYHSYINYDASASVWGNWWGSDWLRCGLPGYTQGSGDIEGSLAGLPDFKTGSKSNVSIPNILKTKWTKEGTYNAKVAKYGNSNTVTGYISDWLAEWVREYGVDGFRCDTAKHVEIEAWKTLKDKCVKALKDWKAANPDKALDDEEFWMTGECFGHKAEKSYYYTSGGFDSMINFEFAPAVNSSNIPSAGAVDGVYSRYANSINNDPDFNVLSYIASHDTTLAKGDRKYAGSFLLMIPGGVQIYYGDETNRPLVNSSFANVDPGAGHQFRSFMNWSNTDAGVLAHWQKVGSFRNNHIAVGAGQHQTISGYSSSSGYTFARTYDDGEVQDSVVATLFAPANTTMSVDVSSVWSDGTIVTNAYDGSTTTVSGGKASFNTGANGTILIEGPQSSISVSLKSSTGSNSFEGSCTLTLALKGTDSASVSIDGGTPFTLQNGGTFKIGENTVEGGQVSVQVTASNAEDTVTKTFVYKKKDPNATISVYFDNTGYNWSTVNAYIYDESGSSVVQNAAWPGQAMTLNSSLGLYEIEVPEKLWGSETRVIFNAGASSPNRYPADMQPGLQLGGESHKFSSGNTWETWSPVVIPPTNPPTNPPVDDKYTTVFLGDVSGDNSVSLADVLKMQKAIIGSETFTQTQLLSSDINGDKSLSLTDVISVMQYQVGKTNNYGVATYKKVLKDTVITI